MAGGMREGWRRSEGGMGGGIQGRWRRVGRRDAGGIEEGWRRNGRTDGRTDAGGMQDAPTPAGRERAPTARLSAAESGFGATRSPKAPQTPLNPLFSGGTLPSPRRTQGGALGAGRGNQGLETRGVFPSCAGPGFQQG